MAEIKKLQVYRCKHCGNIVEVIGGLRQHPVHEVRGGIARPASPA